MEPAKNPDLSVKSDGADVGHRGIQPSFRQANRMLLLPACCTQGQDAASVAITTS